MKTLYSDYELTLTAGEFRPLQAHGRYFKLNSNSVTDELLISIDGQQEQKFPAGRTIELPESDNFIEIGLRNPAGTSADIRLAISNGKIKDDSSEITGVVVVNSGGDTIETPAKYAAATAAPGVAAIAAASANREYFIQNHGSFDVWAGDSAVDGANTRGLKIAPNETLVLNTSAAVYLRADGGASDCSILIISKA